MNFRVTLAALVLASAAGAQSRDSLKVERARIDSLLDKPDTVRIVRVDTVRKVDTVFAPAPAPTPTPTPEPTPSPPSTGTTHEPAGFTLITERNFAAKVENGWRDTGDDRFSIVSVASPKGDGKVGQALYPAGFTGGVASMRTYFSVPNCPRQLYIALWVRFSPNFQGHPTGVNKIFWAWTDGQPNVFLNAQGQGSGALSPGINLQNNVGGAVRLWPVSSATFTRGDWHFWEIILVNNTPGQLNGSATWWLDGKQIGQESGIGPSKVKSCWSEIHWNNTWGGTGGTVTSAMYQQIDYIKVSGAP